MADAATIGGLSGGVHGLGAIGGADTLARAPQAFSDFSRIEQGTPGEVQVGQTTASADAGHAARVVASFLLQG
jgi:hypothetical protein